MITFALLSAFLLCEGAFAVWDRRRKRRLSALGNPPTLPQHTNTTMSRSARACCFGTAEDEVHASYKVSDDEEEDNSETGPSEERSLTITFGGGAWFVMFYIGVGQYIAEHAKSDLKHLLRFCGCSAGK
jgi:hypothetical protein